MNTSVRNIIIVAVAVIVFFFIFKPFTIVNSGYRGLEFTMGKLSNVVLGEGLNWRWPLFQSIKEITIRPIRLDYSIEVGDRGAITKDNQNIGADMTLFYVYEPSELPRFWRETGPDAMENILEKSMKESFKKEIGKYTIFEVAPIQEQIRQNVFEEMTSMVAGYPIDVTEFKLTNYDWPQSFEDQIEKTMQRAQEVKQKEQDLLIAEQEAQKQVKQAEASKTAMITEAEGREAAALLDANAKRASGEGLKDYNAAIAKNLNIEIKMRELEIEKIRAERWNGQYVPNNMYGPIPFDPTGGLQPRG